MGGGNFITQSAPTNFHKFWTRKVLTSGETASMFKEVTTSEKSAIEATDAKWAQPSEELIAQATVCGAVYNSSTGFFELNGLTDLTAKDMRDCLTWGKYESFVGISDSPTYQTSRIVQVRTTIQSVTTTNLIFPRLGWVPENIEVIKFSIPSASELKPIFLLDNRLPLYSGIKLRVIEDYIEPRIATTIGTPSHPAGCKNLETIRIYKLKHNLTANGLSALSLESIAFMITNAANTSPITVTLHADAYARLTDTLIAQAAAKQITFVTT